MSNNAFLQNDLQPQDLTVEQTFHRISSPHLLHGTVTSVFGTLGDGSLRKETLSN